MIKKKIAPHSTVYLRRKRLVYKPLDFSPRFTCKVNLSYTKHPAWFFFAFLLIDRGMQRVNWLPPRTIVCFIKLYLGTVQLSIVSPAELLERLWINVIKFKVVGDWVILFGKNLFSRPNPLWSNMIAIFGCRCKTTINSMLNLIHSWTVKIFFSEIT